MNPEDQKPKKTAVFYATANSETKPSNKRGDNKRTSYGNKGGNKSATNANSKEKRNFGSKKESAFSSRIESFTPKNQSDSPWGGRKPRRSGSNEQNRDRSFEKPASNPKTNSFKQQRKEEVYVYSENSCKAVFENRPDAIVKAFIAEDKANRFKDMIAWLVDTRLGYDIVSDEKLTQLTETPHHGGICLIVKKRKGLTPLQYVNEEANPKQDTILAIEDINNPHNLGGIARTAAFFGVDALMVRDADKMENGAALRVSEGGSESMALIKADDFIADLDYLQQAGYKIVVMMPVRVRSLKNNPLDKARFNHNKTVFVIFQQINEKITNMADEVLYIQGSEAMPALNVSVLTGVLLTTWQNKTKR